MTLYNRLIDPENLWVVIYALKGLEQSTIMQRLGLRATFNPRRCSHHFNLDCSNPEHAEVAKKLVDIAMKVCKIYDIEQLYCIVMILTV